MRHVVGALRILLVGGVVLAAAGCGDKEPDQRKAFIGFLQTRVLDKPGVHVPQLSEEERAPFGPYAEGWTLVTAFHKSMDERVAPEMSAAMSRGAFRSLDDIVARRADIRDIVASMDDMAGTLKTEVATADAAHARLVQPDDLKAVYDKAYARLVSEPAKAFAEVTPVFDQAMAATVKLTDYIEAHKDRVRITGGTLQVSDTRMQTDVNALIRDIQAQQTGMAAAQARVQAVVYGQ